MEENEKKLTEEAAAQTAEAAEGEEKKSIGREIWEWVYTLGLAVIIALLIKGFIFDIVRVDGSSMYPTLIDNDRLIVTKLGYEPEQGDIIILDSRYADREEYYDKLAVSKDKEELSAFDKLLAQKDLPDTLKKRYYVKRVIATEGQTVDLIDGDVYVDGEKLDEEYYSGITAPISGSSVEYPFTVSQGCVFVMGDNRMHSKDSRSDELGEVPNDAILGKSQIRVWPLGSISFTR